MGAVATEDVEPDHAPAGKVEDQVDAAAQLDPADADRPSQKLLTVQTPHPPGSFPRGRRANGHSENPSAPRRGTKRHGTERSTAGPSGLRTTSSSRWSRRWPTGIAIRPPGASWS